MLIGLESAVLPADAIEVGRMSDAWGVRGWFKVVAHSAAPQTLLSSKQWFLLPTKRGVQTFEGTAKLAIKESKIHSDAVVAAAIGIDDRTAAQALKGSRIFISRTNFPVAAKDEYYWVDLIGLTVKNRQDEQLGKVKELVSTGPQTVLVIAYECEGKILERMIPFVSVYIDEVDIAGGRLLVDWQQDY